MLRRPLVGGCFIETGVVDRQSTIRGVLGGKHCSAVWDWKMINMGRDPFLTRGKESVAKQPGVSPPRNNEYGVGGGGLIADFRV